MNVYCYRSGHIIFSKEPMPFGALPIKFNATRKEVEKIKVLSRLAYDNKTYLVPGIPEAENDDAAYYAFEKFVELIEVKQ